MAKSAAAMLLQSRIGQRFEAIVTGAAEKGTWVRVFNPPVEGKLVQGVRGSMWAIKFKWNCCTPTWSAGLLILRGRVIGIPTNRLMSGAINQAGMHRHILRRNVQALSALELSHTEIRRRT